EAVVGDAGGDGPPGGLEEEVTEGRQRFLVGGVVAVERSLPEFGGRGGGSHDGAEGSQRRERRPFVLQRGATPLMTPPRDGSRGRAPHSRVRPSPVRHCVPVISGSASVTTIGK